MTFSFGKKAALGLALAASALIAAPAQARDGYRGHRGGGDDAAIAIGAGMLGLVVGAAIASDRNDRYYDDGYYDDNYSYGYPRAYSYGYPRNYYRYDAYPRHYRYYRGHNGGYNRGWNGRGHGNWGGHHGHRGDHRGNRGHHRGW